MNKLTQLLFVLAVAGLFFIWYIKKQPTLKTKPFDTLIVGTNAEYPPFTFVQHNKIVGFDIDIIKEVGKRLGKKIELKDMPFDALIPQIQLGNIHVIAAGMTPSPKKSKQVFFTKPYLTDDPLLIISLRTNPPIKNVDELHEKEVIVNEGYTSDFYMSSLEGPIIKRLPSPAEAFLALKSGRAYAFVAAQSSTQPFFDQHGKDKFYITPLEGVHESVAVAIAKQYPQLLSSIEQALNEMMEDGTIKALRKKWNL